MNSATPRPAVPIRTACSSDSGTVVELISLVDLHRPAQEVPAALDPMRRALAMETGGPLSHGLNHFLIAEDAHGAPVGAVACGPAMWIYEHPRIPRFMRARLERRVATVHGLAVRPGHRGRGVGSALLHQAEQTFHQAGYAMLTLRHERGMESFYRPLGYTSANRLVMELPLLGLLTQTDRGWKHAVKPLAPETAVTTVQGAPAVTGILPG